MVMKQVLQAREHSRESLLEKVKSESDPKKLKFKINLLSSFSKCKKYFTRITYSSNTRPRT